MTTTTGTNNSFGFPASTTPASDKIATGVTTSESKDMFTKLLVAQIRNQDPLAPSDPSQFVNQLSQLSQTEALQQLAQTTSASASVLQSLQVLAMGAQVGSEVSVETSRVRLDGDKVSGSVQLGGASSVTNLVLTAVDGKQTRVSLPTHIPVHLVYSTAFKGENGIEFRPDVYGRDRKLYAALFSKPAS